MRRIPPIRALGSACVHALALAAVLLAADAALAARIVDVRIGRHPGYARVVLETDAPAEHEILTAPAVTPGEVVVRIQASSAARALPGRGAAMPEVVLEPQPDGTTLARIRAAGPVRVETQVLRAPPRLVLDLRAGAPAAEPAPAPEAGSDIVTEPEPTPAPEPASEPEPPIAPLESPPPVAEAPAEEPLPQEAAAPAEPSPPAHEPGPAPVAMPEPPAVVEMPMPPVESPPPAAIALEPRSLVVGAALGVGLAVIGLALRRGRRVEVADAEVTAVEAPAIEALAPFEEPTGPGEEAAATEEAAPEATGVAEVELAVDVSRMHRRLDARLAEVAARLETVAARQAELDRHEGAQTQEIAAQRAAIARLQRALRPPQRLRKTEKDAG